MGSAAALFVSSTEAFTMQSGRSVEVSNSRAASKKMLASILKMADGDEDGKSKISSDGTFYDDEIDTAPIKSGISDSMKARLMAEAATGLDSDKPQTNVILYISIVVIALVALAGGGILF